jgi:hypothetical protein
MYRIWFLEEQQQEGDEQPADMHRTITYTSHGYIYMYI